MELQNFLQNDGTPEDLKTKYGVNAKRHGKYPNLVLFKYDQIDSPSGNSLVNECRGVILDEKSNWEVVSRGFNRFYNFGDGAAAKIDWSTARVQEKIDGSLMMMYHYDGAWHVASSGTPDASGNVNGDCGKTFAELFWETFNGMGYTLPVFGEDVTYIFELTTPYNRVVIPHTENKLTLLGGRNRITQQELNAEFFKHFKVVREFPLNSIEGILDSFKVINGLRQEGYVVVDAKFNRIKVKHPQYVAMHHIKDGMSTKRLVEIIRSNENTEFLTYFPEYTKEFNELLVKFNSMINEIETMFEANKHLTSQKDFAMQVKDRRASGVYFQMRKSGQTARQIIAAASIDTVVGWL